MVKFHEFLAIAVLLLLGAFILFNAFAPNVYKSARQPGGEYAQAVPTQYGAQAQNAYANNGAQANAAGAQAGSQAAANAAAGGTQTIAMKVINGYYEPRHISVKQGTKVRLELDPNTFRGCMVNFNIWGLGINKRVTSSDYVVEFVADKPGTYKTSCNMGMGDGTLTITPADGSPAPTANPSAAPAPSAGGCGGSGSAGGCGCGGQAALVAQPAPSGSCGGSGGAGGCGCGG